MASTPTTWEATAEDRSTWREIVQEGIKRVDVGRNLHAADRRAGGKKQTSTTPTASLSIPIAAKTVTGNWAGQPQQALPMHAKTLVISK